MIAADTSVWIDFFEGKDSDKVLLFQKSLEDNNLLVPPPVLAEVISFPLLEDNDREMIQKLPRLDIKLGFWDRVGELRQNLIKNKHKARLADCLIAQNCIDCEMPLVTSDHDFRHFSKFGLKLM